MVEGSSMRMTAATIRSHKENRSDGRHRRIEPCEIVLNVIRDEAPCAL
jgi:hypothetical protein